MSYTQFCSQYFVNCCICQTLTKLDLCIKSEFAQRTELSGIISSIGRLREQITAYKRSRRIRMNLHLVIMEVAILESLLVELELKLDELRITSDEWERPL